MAKKKSSSLHYETITPLLKSILNDIMESPLFDPFYLVGGTSLSLRLGHRKSVDIDLFYHDEIIDPCDCLDNIRIASLEDVIAMKVDVVSCGGRKKDFWDLHELLNTYSISEMIEFHKHRYEYTHDRNQLIANFTDFSYADEDIDPVCLKGKEWELIKLDFVEKIDLL